MEANKGPTNTSQWCHWGAASTGFTLLLTDDVVRVQVSGGDICLGCRVDFFPQQMSTADSLIFNHCLDLQSLNPGAKQRHLIRRFPRSIPQGVLLPASRYPRLLHGCI